MPARPARARLPLGAGWLRARTLVVSAESFGCSQPKCHRERSEPASEVEGSATPTPITRSWIDPSSCLLRMTLASDRPVTCGTLYLPTSQAGQRDAFDDLALAEDVHHQHRD